MHKILSAVFLLLSFTAVLSRDAGDGSCVPDPSNFKLDNEKIHSADICYERSYRTTVSLSCDWDNYQFKVEMKTGVQSEGGAIEFYDYTKLAKKQTSSNKVTRFITNRAAVCDIGAETPKTATYGYPDQFAQASEGEMVIENGKLYYKRSVIVKENIVFPEDCDTQLHKTAVVTLSCCADPQPPVGDYLTPPLNQYCNLSHCDDAIINCTCIETLSSQPRGQNYYRLSAASNVQTNENVQWEITGITATIANGNHISVPSVFLNTSGMAAPLNQIGFEQCPNKLPERRFNPTQQYQFNVFEFTGHEGKLIGVECQARFCAVRGSKNEKNRPICTHKPKVESCTKK